MDLYEKVQDFYRRYLRDVMEEVAGYLKQTQLYSVLVGNNGGYIIDPSSEVLGISSEAPNVLERLVFYKKSKDGNGKSHGREYKKRGDNKGGGNPKRRNGKGRSRGKKAKGE